MPWLSLEEVPFRDVEELGRERIHLRRQHAKLTRETVVQDDGGNGSRQSDGGGDQRLGDTGRDRLDAGRSGGGKTHEGRHDAPHGPEEADERRGARGGGEKREPALEPRHLLGPGALHGALHGFDASELGLLAALGAVTLQAGETLQLLVSGAKYLGNGTVLHVGAGRLDGGEVLRLPEHVDEACRLPARPAHLPSLRERDTPGRHRRRHQGEQHQADDPARADRELPDVTPRNGRRRQDRGLGCDGSGDEQQAQDLEDHVSSSAGPAAASPHHSRTSSGGVPERQIRRLVCLALRARPGYRLAIIRGRPSAGARSEGEFDPWRSVSASTASGVSAGTCCAPALMSPAWSSWRSTTSRTPRPWRTC